MHCFQQTIWSILGIIIVICHKYRDFLCVYFWFQQELETERASLLTRCVIAEEQVTSLQEYIDTHLKK